MLLSIYNFEKIEKNSMNEAIGDTYVVPDYFQYYTTGLESIVNENPSLFFISDRLDNERSEVLAWKYYDDSAMADVILATNNDVFLWDSPTDWDTQQLVKDQKMNYIKKLNKVQMTEDEELYWGNKMDRKVIEVNDNQSTIILPKMSEINRVIRYMKDYIRGREVK